MDRPAWNPARRCTGTNRAGERCQRQPIPGGEVCVMHGGAAPQVQRSAKARLLAGADLAIDYLLNLLTPRPPCEHCGRSDADRDPVIVKACQLVLDRSGFHPTLAVEHVASPDPIATFTIDEVVEKLEKMLADAIAVRDAEHDRVGALDAVLVDDAFVVPEDDAPLPPEPEAPGPESAEVWSSPPGDGTKGEVND